jgi:DNA-binding transcriptional regulator GbsR (MarR family)
MLYDLLRASQPLTVDEMIERTGWTRANVRFTMGSLRRFRRLAATYECGIWRYMLAANADRPAVKEPQALRFLLHTPKR